MQKCKLFLILIAAVLSVGAPAFAQFGQSEPIVSSEVLLSVDRLRAGDTFELAVRATVKDGYHVGAHDEDALYRTMLTLEAPKAITFDEPAFPEGDRYEATFVVRVNGRVARDAKAGKITIVSRLDAQACAGEVCYPPEETESRLEVAVAGAGGRVTRINTDLFGSGTAASGGDEGRNMAARLANANIFTRLLILYGIGLLLAFTPCVYPMIPVTVGYFSGQGESGTRKVVALAAIYVLGLALTYSILGAVAALTGQAFGAAMQSPIVLRVIALVLIALALSMFGLYELRPPAFIAKRSAGRTGVAGALIMGLIFGIVVAPCVGPVVIGLMLYVASVGSAALGFFLFFMLALGIGTPLFFLAAFSAKLPVPGMWMVAIRKVAGFLLIGAAAYFLQPTLPDSVARLLIPVVLVAAGIYLGFFEKSVRSTRITWSMGKVVCAAAVAVAVIMVVPGTRGPSLEWEPYYEGGIAEAAGEGKPSMLDFTAEWCVVCKELEHGPFSDPKVVEAAAGFRKFQVDATDHTDKKVAAAVKQYGVRGFPTVIFFDSSGAEVESARIVGSVDAKGVLKRIEMTR